MFCKDIQSRLVNWKFSSALQYAEREGSGVTDEEMELIRALSITYGNSGWFEGAMGSIVQAAVAHLLGVT